jgi:hypothetical protein
MNSISRIHPADALSHEQKCRIYYSRVVDLAVVSGLLFPDPDAEVGHFAFSRHYYEGKEFDQRLRAALVEFEQRHPELVRERRAAGNRAYMGVVEDFLRSDSSDKLHDLILLGASHAIWPVGTSFTLTYPWDLAGNGQPVRFRDDLSEFMKRRIPEILKRAGKLRTPHLFGKQ